MKKVKLETLLSLGKQRSFQYLLILALVYFLFFTFQYHFLFSSSSSTTSSSSVSSIDHKLGPPLDGEARVLQKEALLRPAWVSFAAPAPTEKRESKLVLSGIAFHDVDSKVSFSELHNVALDAWKVGKGMFQELEKAEPPMNTAKSHTFDDCPHSVVMSGTVFHLRGRVMALPCGLTLGSHVTVIGKPLGAHPEYDPKIMKREEGDGAVMVSQFMMELRGTNAVEGEEPTRILHFNPRLKGDWSFLPVIEMNTCYGKQWDVAQRCEGWKSGAEEETVDEYVKCEKWIRADDDHSEESKTNWWLNRLIGRQRRKVSFDWAFPFVEEKLFVLTLSTGLEGYHINVNGRHISSFPYRSNFVLEDASGLALYGDIDVKSIFAGSLPTAHPNLSHNFLEMSSKWKALPLPDGPIELFIGILSAGNHFAARMAVRKTWMQSIAKLPNVVARFFVAMDIHKVVNMELKKEAEFFGDIVFVPYLDRYDLVVLKTVAICEYGTRALSAKYVMKCDDDTFVRVNMVLNVVKQVHNSRSLYVGNINYYHSPLRSGKWAVTYEEWPEEVYPPYANGPGYVISSDIAWFVISEFEKHKLRLFKMEDVSMGLWVQRFNDTKAVEYVHSQSFCQFGCIEYYYTAHYQSPTQMVCMWEKLKSGKPYCCNR